MSHFMVFIIIIIIFETGHAVIQEVGLKFMASSDPLAPSPLPLSQGGG